MSDKIVATMKCTTDIHLREDQLQVVRKAINLAVAGKENCNKRNKDGYFVSNVPKDIDLLLQEAHHRINMSSFIEVTFDVTDDGRFINLRMG